MDIQLPQIIFQIINFSVVVGGLTYLLYKPILKVLEERAQRIEEAQKAAIDTLAKQEKQEEVKKQKEKEAQKQAAEIIAEAKKEAAKLSADLTQKAQEHAKAQILKFQNEWQEQKKEMISDLKKQFAKEVIKTSEKVLGAQLDQKAHAKLIDEELKTLLSKI